MKATYVVSILRISIQCVWQLIMVLKALCVACIALALCALAPLWFCGPMIPFPGVPPLHAWAREVLMGTMDVATFVGHLQEALPAIGVSWIIVGVGVLWSFCAALVFWPVLALMRPPSGTEEP